MDIIAISGLVIGGAGTIAAIVAAFKAVTAVRLAKEAPTKEDLGRVESHIAQVEGHLAEENQRVQLSRLVERVSISVSGRIWSGAPLTLKLSVTDPNVAISHIDLINSRDMLTGGFDCSPSDPLSFTATLPPGTLERWFNSGDSDLSTDRKHVLIHAVIKIGEQETQRTFSVIVRQGLEPAKVGGGLQLFFEVSGTC
jgi:hypothetical protein